MSDFFSSIKALIEKVNLIVLLLSLAVAILVYKVWLLDLVWAAFSFCLAYPCIAGLHQLIVYWYKEHQAKISVEKRNARIEKEKQEKDEQVKAHFSTIYESLPYDTKKGLIMLYRIPEIEGGFKNVRILNEDNENYQFICNAIYVVKSRDFSNPYVYWEDMLNKSILHIVPDFYKVLEEKSKTFDL